MPMILEKASKIDLIRSFGKLTLHQILAEKYPSIGQLKQSYGQETTEKAVAVIIADLSTSFDGALQKDDILELVAEISCTYLRNLSLEDLFFLCRNIKGSKIYGKFGVNTVLQAMNGYWDKRCDESAKLSLNKHYSQQFTDDRKSITQLKTEKDAFKQAHIHYLRQAEKSKVLNNGKKRNDTAKK